MILDVTTQPQAINLAGIQDDSLLYNAGPDTLYVDTNGSVSSVLSIPIPALTYLPWRTGTPLWVVSRGYSRLVATPTYDAPSTSGSARQQRILAVSGVTSSITTLNDISDIAECSAYETLLISYRAVMGWAISGNTIQWAIDWYDSDQVFIERTTVYMMPPLNSSTEAASESRISRMQIPVRGAFFSLSAFCIAETFVYELNVVGLTQARTLLLSPSSDSSSTTPPERPDQPFALAGSGVVNHWSEDSATYTITTGTWINVFIKSLKRNLKVVFDWQAASDPTGAGALALISAIDGKALSANATIAAATRRQEFNFILPMSIPVYLDFVSNPTSVNNPVVKLIWSD